MVSWRHRVGGCDITVEGFAVATVTLDAVPHHTPTASTAIGMTSD